MSERIKKSLADVRVYSAPKINGHPAPVLRTLLISEGYLTGKDVEQERINHATELARGKVVSVCVGIENKDDHLTITTMCPLLDMQSGCMQGYEMKPGEAVSCPKGRGIIRIGSDNLIDLLPNEGNITNQTQPSEVLG